MTLYRQLILGIVALLAVIFVGSVVISSKSAQSYTERSVSGHNQNYANLLTLLLNSECAQIECDKPHLETWLKPIIDQGHFKSIKLVSPDGDALFTDEAPEQEGTAPEWFKNAFPIDPLPGTASIQAGWTPLGDLSLTTPVEGVYTQLWEGSVRLTILFLIAAVVTGLLTNYALKLLLKPLDRVVNQANALGERRFIKTPLPYTFEFRRVVTAINNLADRVKAMLDQEAETLNRYRQELQEDKVTKLLNRDHFMTVFRSTLQRDDSSGSGALAILRFSNIVGLNEQFGYKKVDDMLADFGDAVRWLLNINGGWTGSRLNGSDFMVLAPALKQRSKIYVDSEGDFEVIEADRSKEPRGEGGQTMARPSIHIQVLGEAQLGAADSIRITETPDIGDVAHVGEGRIVYQSDIGIEGRTNFSFSVTLDGIEQTHQIRVLMASINDPESVGRELQEQAIKVLTQHGMQDATDVPVSAIYFNPLDPVGGLLSALDKTLTETDAAGQSGLGIAFMGNGDATFAAQEMEGWRDIFKEAFEKKLFELVTTPVSKLDGSLLHQEANLVLRRPSELLNGGQFLPWITRLNMMEAMDRVAVELALDYIDEHDEAISVKLSSEVIREKEFKIWFEETLSARGNGLHPLLHMQVNEAMAFRYLDAFRDLCATARRFGVKTGIEHMGHHMTKIGRLTDVGLDFMKIDVFFVKDVDKDPVNQNLLKTLATLAHSLGIHAIAEGVASQDEFSMVSKLGLDGAKTPSFELAVDSGAGGDDLLTNEAQVNVTLVEGADHWEYSLDGGNTWTVGKGTSFDLEQNKSYQIGQVRVRQVDAEGVAGSEGYNHAVITTDMEVPVPELNISENGHVQVTLAEDVASWQFSWDGGENWNPGAGTSFQLPRGRTFAPGQVQVLQTDRAGNVSEIGENIEAINT